MYLSDQDLATFDSYRRAFARSENGDICFGNFVSGDSLLHLWHEAKSEHLFRIFGDKLILEKPITYNKPIPAISRELTTAKSDKASSIKAFDYWFRKWIENNIQDYPAPCAFFSDDYYRLRELLDSDLLATNRIPEHWDPYTLDIYGININVAPNAKVIKILYKIVKSSKSEEGMRLFEEFRLAHSRYLNTAKLHGTLCLSIHPMDYLTMSHNTCGWTSCMNWPEDGSYRMGTVELMNSCNTIVAYLRNDDEIYWNDKSWNNKKWRSLFIVDPELLISVKGYPYTAEPLATIALEWIKELVEPLWGEFYPVEKIITWDTTKFHDIEITISPETGYSNKMYNDFGACEHWGCLRKNYEYSDVLSIAYGGPQQCMVCGATEDTSDFHESENLVCCCNCEDDDTRYSYCNNCGRRIFNEDACWINDDPYCDDCVEECAFPDAFTGSMELEYYQETLYLASKPDAPTTEDMHIHIHEYHLKRPPALHHYGMGSWERIERPIARYNEENGLWYWNLADVNEAIVRNDFGEEAVEKYFS